MIACFSIWTARCSAVMSRPTGAVETLAKAARRKLFVTNNASRSADRGRRASARHGLHRPTADDVVTSAQSAAHAAGRTSCSPGRAVLIVGTESLAAEIAAVGLRPVRSYDDEPGRRRPRPLAGDRLGRSSPRRRWPSGPGRCGWRPMSTPPCRPSAVCCPATDRWWPRCEPRPTPSRRSRASRRRRCCTMRWRAATFTTPLVVGDRLDTDIAGANAAGLPSLMVLTGVNTARDTVHAMPRTAPDLHRPRPALAARRTPDALAVAAATGVARRTSARRRRSPSARPATTRATDCRSFAPSPTRCGTRGLDGPTVTHRGRRRHGARRPATLVPADLESTSVEQRMSTDPDQIRAEIDALLAELPDPARDSDDDARRSRSRRASRAGCPRRTTCWCRRWSRRRRAESAVPRRARVDAELVRRGLARSRQQAAELIGAGQGQHRRHARGQARHRRRGRLPR